VELVDADVAVERRGVRVDESGLRVVGGKGDRQQTALAVGGGRDAQERARPPTVAQHDDAAAALDDEEPVGIAGRSGDVDGRREAPDRAQ
jgi:hypothetical protein